MKITHLIPALVGLALTIGTTEVGAHCQVPCGIFSDQHRFEAMLEDHTTIAKAGVQITELVANNDALSANQIARWVVTKEDHAQNIQDTIAAYFMAQRIKADADNYAEALTAAHKVMTAAMKAKQDPAPEVAEALKTAIFEFYTAYTGKEPDFHTHE